MKFKLLSIGQKFEYEGETYVKTSPLVASHTATGHNKMIPRYATLKLLEATTKIDEQTHNKTVSLLDTLNAFNHFYERCIYVLEAHDALMPTIKNELDKARDEFTEILK